MQTTTNLNCKSVRCKESHLTSAFHQIKAHYNTFFSFHTTTTKKPDMYNYMYLCMCVWFYSNTSVIYFFSIFVLFSLFYYYFPLKITTTKTKKHIFLRKYVYLCVCMLVRVAQISLYMNIHGPKKLYEYISYHRCNVRCKRCRCGKRCEERSFACCCNRVQSSPPYILYMISLAEHIDKHKHIVHSWKGQHIIFCYFLHARAVTCFPGHGQQFKSHLRCKRTKVFTAGKRDQKLPVFVGFMWPEVLEISSSKVGPW